MTDHERIPVTVLAGYLGAGKTTLINRLLAAPDGTRIAVLVNDFGEVNIDAQLLRTPAPGDHPTGVQLLGDQPIGAPAAGIIELSGGCICCDLSLGLGPALDAVRALDPAPDHVVIEVSGVGEPASVAAWAATPGFRLDSVVVTVALDTAAERAADRWVGDVVRRQLGQADLVLATKADLVPGVDRAAALAAIDAVTSAPIVLVDPAQPVSDLLVEPGGPGPTLPSHGAPRSPAGAHMDHVVAADRFVAAAWTADDPAGVDVDTLAASLAADPTLLRAKGYVRDARTGRRVLLQVVGDRAEATPAGSWPPGTTSLLSLIRRRPTDPG